MAIIDGVEINPFYNRVSSEVRGELAYRSKVYGNKIRSTAPTEKQDDGAMRLTWAYGKTAWAKVSGNGVSLGNYNYRLMSDASGNLTLYDSTRNQPKFPLLQTLEVTNEGTLGSLIRGSFTFIAYPDITSAGFNMNALEKAFFTPGEEVSISWGWSVRTGGANFGKFEGIINNFDWSVNGDLSINGRCQVVSKGTLAVGISGEQTNPDSKLEKDPLGQPLPDGGLASLIEKEIQTLTDKNPTALERGKTQYYPSGTNGQKLSYYAIGMPMSPADDTGGGTQPPAGTNPSPPKDPPKPIVQSVYYIKFGDLVQHIYDAIKNSVMGEMIASIQVWGNKMQYYTVFGGTKESGLVSCTPEEVFFPDPMMGKYGSFKPFEKSLMNPVENECEVAGTLIATNTIIEVYKHHLSTNQTSIEGKNLVEFFNELIGKINLASGEVYQLTATIIDPPLGAKETRSILVIEDTNISDADKEDVIPYQFEATIAKPIMKSVSITCKPPALAAAAVFAEGRGAAVAAPVDVKYDKKESTQELTDARSQIDEIVKSFETSGAGKKFTTGLKDNYAKLKRSAGTGHWLNKVLYPIDFSVTMDGIDGFYFGNVIKTNLVPDSYGEMVFVVTKVAHSIKDGVWETTLTTKARTEG
jgi:hypothetical protein